jgi:hypothetical protein
MNIPKYKSLNYLYLANAKTNLEGKLFLLEQMLDKADEILKNKKGDIAIRKLHFLQLDIIAKLCYVIEDFLYLHYLVRKDTKKIYKEIVRNLTRWANDEAGFIEKQLKIKDIKKVYCYPEILQLKLKDVEKKVLRGVVKAEISFHRGNLKEIGSFWNKHRKIYNIYKHGCSIVTGMIDQNDVNKPSYFYARGKEKKSIKTYMIECADRLFTDYDNMRMKVHAEYDSLVINNETRIINRGKSFIPNLFFVNSKLDKDSRDRAIDIGKRVNKKILSPGEVKRLVEIKESALMKWRGKSSYYIVPIKKDIMFSHKGKMESTRIKKK